MTIAQAYQGRQYYSPDLQFGGDRVFIGIACMVGGLAEPVQAMLDTGAEWCVPSAELGELLGIGAHTAPTERLSTRFGVLYGHLDRIPEPMSAGMFLPGVAALGLLRRCKRR